MIALAIVLAFISTDAIDDGATFRAAYGSIDKLEALGAARPVGRWTDDAWYEAAQLAERAGDFDRARRDYDAALAIATDPQLLKRARGMRDRLDTITGGGQWTEVARRHEALATEALGDGEPQDALAGLEAILREHPAYPRAQAVRGLLAKAWEREGAIDTAIGWQRAAVSAAVADRWMVRLELVRMLLRSAELEHAESELAQLRRDPGVDRGALTLATSALETARTRRWLRRGLAAVLGCLGLVFAIVLRRESGSWGAAARRLARPPFEVWFIVPIAGVLSVVARTGNPLVARAVLVVAIAGATVSWLSGALLESAPRPLGSRRIVGQAVLALVAVAACTYLAVDHGRLIDLLSETWRSGPALP